MRKFVVITTVAVMVTGCGMARVAYNNSGFALRLMADDYFEFQEDQEQFFKAQLTRFQQWHRNEELPLYARLLDDASDRVGRGLQREDVLWAFTEVRARYRVFAAQAVEEAVPV